MLLLTLPCSEISAAGKLTQPDVSEPAKLEAYLSSFWAAQGLDARQSSFLAMQLVRSQHPCCNVAYCTALLARMARVLPGINFPKLVSREPQILDTTPEGAVRVMVTLNTGLGLGCNPVVMVKR